MEPPRRALSDVQLRCRSDPAPPRCRHSTGCWVRTQHLTQHSRGRPYRFLIPRPWNARWYIKMAGGRLPACKKEGFRRARGTSAVQRPSRAKSKTNNTGDSHVVTHRSTNPAITCLYMAERTGCLAFTYLWSFVLDLHVSQLIYLHPPPHTAASAPCPSFRGRPYRPLRTCIARGLAGPVPNLPPEISAYAFTLSSSWPCPSFRGRPCRLPRTCRNPSNPFVQYTRLQVRAHHIR